MSDEWEMNREDEELWLIDKIDVSHRVRIAEVYEEAEAQLMTSAPELLAACQAMLAAFKHIPIPDDGTEASTDLWAARKALQAAIGKATGQ